VGNASRAAEALILAALLAFGAARPAAGQSAAPAGCKLVRAAEWPVWLYRDLPILEGVNAECPLNYREYDSALMELEKGK
jgi:hypothetical protein